MLTRLPTVVTLLCLCLFVSSARAETEAGANNYLGIATTSQTAALAAWSDADNAGQLQSSALELAETTYFADPGSYPAAVKDRLADAWEARLAGNTYYGRGMDNNWSGDNSFALGMEGYAAKNWDQAVDGFRDAEGYYNAAAGNFADARACYASAQASAYAALELMLSP